MELTLKIQLHSINFLYDPACALPPPLNKTNLGLGETVVMIVCNYSPIMGIGSEGGPKRDWIASKARTPDNSAVSITDAKAA